MKNYIKLTLLIFLCITTYAGSMMASQRTNKRTGDPINELSDQPPAKIQAKKLFRCPQCPITFGTPTGLRLHERTHAAPQKLCTWPTCKYATCRDSDLGVHEGRHANAAFNCSCGCTSRLPGTPASALQPISSSTRDAQIITTTTTTQLANKINPILLIATQNNSNQIPPIDYQNTGFPAITNQPQLDKLALAASASFTPEQVALDKAYPLFPGLPEDS